MENGSLSGNVDSVIIQVQWCDSNIQNTDKKRNITLDQIFQQKESKQEILANFE